MSAAQDLESLPHLEDLASKSANIRKAHEIIHNAYRHAYFALTASDSDPQRLRVHSHRLLNRLLPIIQEMESRISNDRLWLLQTTTQICGLITELERSAAEAEQQFVPFIIRVTDLLTLILFDR